MKIKYGIFMLMLFCVALLSLVHSYQTYHKQKKLLIEGINKKLYTAAMMARSTLPQDYHDNLINSSSITKEKFDGIVSRYNQLCLDLNLEYLWSLMEINGKIVFTTSTSPDKNTMNQKHAKFFELHSNPELYTKTFLTQKPQYQNNIDKWGEIQVVLIPFQDIHGRPYLFGASMELSEVDELLSQSIKEAIYLGFGFLLVGLILSYILSKLLSEPLNTLAVETTKIASGQLDKRLEVKGFFEQIILARNFNQMVLSIKEKMTALAESEEKSRITLDSIGDAVIVTDTDGDIVLMNPVAENLTGWKMVKAKGKPIEEVFNIIDSKTEKKAENPAIRVVEKLEIVGLGDHTLLIAKDGRRYQISDSAAPIIGSEGDLIGVVLVFRNITEEYKMREKIIKSEQKYKTLFEKTSDAIFIVNKKTGRYLDANESALKLTGRNWSELRQLTTQDVAPERAENRLQKLNGPKTIQDLGQTEYIRPDGEKRIAALIAIPLSEDTVIGIARDITEELILNGRLRQSQKMEAIGTLAGGIAHDFNNILSAIYGYSQLAQTNIKDPEKATQDIDQILKGAKRAAELVQQILTFSRQTEYQKYRFDLYKGVGEALKLLRSSIPSTIEIVKKLDSKSTVYADPTRIHQVVMNLCTNAYHAMRKTGGTLTVSLTDVDVGESKYLWDKKIIPGEYLKLEISDTGIGMNNYELEKAFEPYFTTKGLGQGTGLGLALVHAIVDEHDSFLDVHSEPSGGTSFYIYFPIVKAKSKDYGGPQKTNNVLSSKSTQLKGVDNEQEKETVQFRIQS